MSIEVPGLEPDATEIQMTGYKLLKSNQISHHTQIDAQSININCHDLSSLVWVWERLPSQTKASIMLLPQT